MQCLLFVGFSHAAASVRFPYFLRINYFFQCLIVVLNIPNHKLFSSPPLTRFINGTGKIVASSLRQSNISIWYSVFHVPEVPCYHFPGFCFPIWSCPPPFRTPWVFRKLLKTCGSSQPSRIINETTSVSSLVLRSTEENVQAFPSSSPSIRISNPSSTFCHFTC